MKKRIKKNATMKLMRKVTSKRRKIMIMKKVVRNMKLKKENTIHRMTKVRSMKHMLRIKGKEQKMIVIMRKVRNMKKNQLKMIKIKMAKIRNMKKKNHLKMIKIRLWSPPLKLHHYLLFLSPFLFGVRLE